MADVKLDKLPSVSIPSVFWMFVITGVVSGLVVWIVTSEVTLPKIGQQSGNTNKRKPKAPLRHPMLNARQKTHTVRKNVSIAHEMRHAVPVSHGPSGGGAITEAAYNQQPVEHAAAFGPFENMPQMEVITTK